MNLFEIIFEKIFYFRIYIIEFILFPFIEIISKF